MATNTVAKFSLIGFMLRDHCTRELHDEKLKQETAIFTKKILQMCTKKEVKVRLWLINNWIQRET